MKSYTKITPAEPKTISEWELLAAAFVDRTLKGGDGPLGSLEWLYCTIGYHPTTIAFMTGYLGQTPHIWGADYGYAYRAGDLARRIHYDRKTTVTRIWEALASRGRKWTTIEEIDKLTDLAFVESTRHYVQHLVREGLLERAEAYNDSRAHRLGRITYLYRCVLPSRRASR